MLRDTRLSGKISYHMSRVPSPLRESEKAIELIKSHTSGYNDLLDLWFLMVKLDSCDSWCMHQTGLFSSATIVPQSKFNGEL